MCGLQIISPTLALMFFMLFRGSFGREQEFFILMKFNFSLSFDGLDLGIENSSQTLGPEYVLGFILKVLSFTFYFSSLVHSKLISFFLMFQICSSINQERCFPHPIIFTFQGCYRLFKFTFGH